jgi:hypothetical protein
MISFQLQEDALRDRIAVARRLVDETHGASPLTIARDTRGLAVVLLFAAYENLLTSVTRALLEKAVALKVSNRRLQPGFRVFAMAPAARSLRDLSSKKIYSHGLPRLVAVAGDSSRVSSIDTNSFPDDGSFMKTSQITLWCDLFNVGDPRQILHRTWATIDAVVSNRNGIAHGRLTPAEVGRGYSGQQIRDLITDWELDWMDFLSVVQNLASKRDFYRLPR